MATPTADVAGVLFEVARSGSTVWAGSTLACDFGGANTDTWDYDTEMSEAPAADLYDVASSIVDWGNDAGRPWTGAITFSWSITDRDPGLGVTVTASSSGAWTPSGGLATFAAWSTTPSAASISTPALSVVAGSVLCTPSVGNVTKWQGPGRGYSPRSSYQTGTAATSAGRGYFNLVLDEQHTAKMGEVLRTLSSPRRGHIYTTHLDTWLQLTLGAASAEVADRTGIYRVSFEVQG